MNNKIILTFLFIVVLFVKYSFAQEITYPTGGNSYYGNPFDDGNLGVFNNYRITGLSNATVGASSVTPIKGTMSLRSVNRSSSLTNGIYGRILISGATISSGMEWSFLYKYTTTNNSTPSEIVDFTSVTTGQAGFRYWIGSNNTNPSANGGLGLYFTQIGDVLYFKSKESDFYTRDVFNYTLTPNTSFNIKLKKTGGGYALFVDAYTVNKTDATTLISSSNFGGLSSYQYTVLDVNEVRTTNTNYLQFDDIKLYTETSSITNITSTVKGLSTSPLSQGQKNAVVFGYKLNLRGVFNIKSTQMADNLGNSSEFLSGARFYQSDDDVFSPDTDPIVATMSIPAGGTLSFTSDYDIGSSEQFGSDKYYFVAVDILPNSNLGTQIIFKNLNIAYNNYNGSVTNFQPSLTVNNYTISSSYIWTGVSSTDWATPGNWQIFSNGYYNSAVTALTLPAIGSFVLIPNLALNNPISSANTTIDLASLSIESNRIATFYANLSISNSLNGKGAIQFASSTPTSSILTIASTANASIGSLIINKGASNNTVTMAGTGLLNITNNLTPIQGNLISNGNLVLKSNETSSAYVTAINTANSTITGNVSVERFMKGGLNAFRGYRLMSSPVLQTTTQYNVQNLMQNIYITGAGGAANGFDASPNNGATVYKYKESNLGTASANDYTPITSVSTDYFNKGQGMYLFYRGLKMSTDQNNTTRFSTAVVPEDNVVVFRGTLNQGTVDVNLFYTPTSPSNNADGFNLVGNPYASTIDLNSGNVTATDAVTTKNFYVLDPTTKQFAVYSKATGLTTGNASRYISSGQGFFVKATGLNQKITFTENAKTTQQLSTSLTPRLLMGLSSMVAPEILQNMRLTMVNKVDSNAKDDIVLYFNSGATAAYNDAEDAFDFGGNGTTFLSSLSSDQVKLSINALPFITENTRISVVANSSVSGDFNFNGDNLNTINKKWNVFLVDHYKTDSVKLNLTPNYSFTVNKSIPDTYATNRFEITFHEKESFVASISSFDGATFNQDVNLTWKPLTTRPHNVVFTLQRSKDNINFTSIYSIQSDSRSIYHYKDNKPGFGLFYYRLKQEDVNAHIAFTNALPFTITNTVISTNGFVMYPNPVASNYTIDLIVPNVNEVQVRILDVFGKVVQRYATNTQSWKMDASLLIKGVYIVELVNTKTNKLIGLSKFLKM